MKGSKTRLDTPGREGQAVHAIFDSSTSQLVVLAEAQKTALKTTLAANSADGGDDKGAKISKTGIHELISGRDCEDWDVAEPNSKHESLCVARGIAFFDLGSIAGHTGGAPSLGTWMKDERDAFPLRAITSASTGAIESRAQVMLLMPHPVEDSSFVVPAGYRTVPMPAAPH